LVNCIPQLSWSCTTRNVRFRESEKSRIFVKVTKTKVLAAFGQLVDVIFGANKFPIGISETKIPEGISEYAHLDPQNPLPGIETSEENPEGEEFPEEKEETHLMLVLMVMVKY
jgi:hypothetical protein